MSSTTPEEGDTQQPNTNLQTTEESIGAARARNDNSNPQQGTGGSGVRLSVSVEARGQPEHMLNNPSDANDANGGGGSLGSGEAQRKSLSVPPFKKDSRKLFVGGLPSDITDAEFRTFFEQFGELVDSVVMFDYETQRSRGFGFVTFKDAEVSRQMLTLGRDPNGPPTGRVQMRDKLIEIKPAEPKESRGGGRFNRRSNNTNNSATASHNRSYGHQSHVPFDPSTPYFGAEGAGGMPFQPAPPYFPPGMMPPGCMAPAYYHPHHPHVAPVPPAAGPPVYNPAQPPQIEYGAYAPEGVPMGVVAPLAFVPVAHPAPFVGAPVIQPASVMQPVAPGIPIKPDQMGHQQQSSA